MPKCMTLNDLLVRLKAVPNCQSISVFGLRKIVPNPITFVAGSCRETGVTIEITDFDLNAGMFVFAL